MTGTAATASVVATLAISVGLTEVAGMDLSPLYAYGPLGMMCVWLMWKGDSRLKEVEQTVTLSLKDNASSQDRATKATMLLLVAIPEVSESIKVQARQLAEDAEQAIKKREAK